MGADLGCGDASVVCQWLSLPGASLAVHLLSARRGRSSRGSPNPDRYQGYVATTRLFHHQELDGCTTAAWELGLFVPRELGRDEPVPTRPSPGPPTTLASIIDPLVRGARAAHPCTQDGVSQEGVQFDGQAVLESGLFPGQEWDRTVICRSAPVVSRTGRGV